MSSMATPFFFVRFSLREIFHLKCSFTTRYNFANFNLKLLKVLT